MSMYKSISIFNFKTFNKLKLEGLSPINIITGMNNVGKTALLEALYLLIGCENIGLALKINTFRGISEFTGDPAKIREAMWLPLFRNLQPGDPITLVGELTDGSILKSVIEVEPPTYVVEPTQNSTGITPTSPPSIKFGEKLVLTFSHHNVTARTSLIIHPRGPRVEPVPSTPLFPGYFISSYPPLNLREEAELFGELEATRKIQTILPSLQILEPRLERLAVIVSGGIPMIHVDIGLPKMVPLALMGDGLRRMTKILLAIENSPDGVVLIDDVEFGIHHSNITRIWRSLIQASSRNRTQIFVTTHSYEWIRGAIDIIGESFVAELSLYRVERHNSEVEVVSYDRKSMSSAMKAELEVR
jgi:hypothetical protein